MKQGKVFDKLTARKNVQGIEFADKTCTVTLTDGASKVCKTAHEARLFIEGKNINGAVLKMDTPVVAQVAAATKRSPLSPEALGGTKVTLNNSSVCGTEALETITLDADFVRLCCPEAVIPAGASRVRVRTEQAAIMIAAGPAH
jgi:hypothetical protein